MSVLAWFRVDGRPRTKGSLKVWCQKNARHTVRVEEEVEDSKRWRRAVAVATQRNSREAWGKARLGHAGPVEVRLVCWFQPRVSVDARQKGAIIPSHQTPFPTDVMLGDADKLARNVGDALVDAGLLADDSQITDWMVAKRWTDGGPPFVEVLVREMDLSEATGSPNWAARGELVAS